MCQNLRGRKSKFLIRYGKITNEKGTSGKGKWEKVSHLNQVDQIRWREGKLEGKEKKREIKRRRVRSSTFSLDFIEIGPSVFVRARGKVQLHDKSFTWVRESGVFTKLQEVGFFLLGLFLS